MQRNRLMIGVLLVIAATQVGMALFNRELAGLHINFAVGALVLAVLVWKSGFQFPARDQRPPEQARARHRTGLRLFALGTLASVLWVAFGPWKPRVEFDLAGFLYLIENIGPLLVLGVFIAIAVVGLTRMSGR